MVTSLRSQRPTKRKTRPSLTGLREFEMGGLEQVRQCRVYSPSSLLIGGHGIDRGGGDILVPEGLLYNGEVNVLSHQRESESMLEAMRMPPIHRQPGSFSNVL